MDVDVDKVIAVLRQQVSDLMFQNILLMIQLQRPDEAEGNDQVDE